MSWNVALPADSSKLRLSAQYIRTNWTAIQNVISSSNLAAGAPYIPPTAPIWMYTNVAPTGWTLVAGLGDRLLAVAGGASQYNVAGGTQAGTWNGPAHTLTTDQIPSHSHNYDKAGDVVGPGNLSGSGRVIVYVSTATSSVGGGLSHQHDYTATRPQANVGIICTKNV